LTQHDTENILQKYIPHIILVAILIVLFFKWDTALTYLGLKTETPSSATQDFQRSVVKVITQPVEIKENSRSFEAVGTGRAHMSVDIYPSVSEEVTEVLFSAGEDVKQGDILVQLDNRQEKLAMQLAEVQLKDAQRLLDRYELAVKEGAVPESEVDSARGDFEAAQVGLEQAKLALEDRQIKAPFNGIVGIPNIDVGDRVDTSTLITGIDARNVLYLDFEIPENLMEKLQSTQSDPQTIKATTPAYLSLEFTGHISALENRVDPQTRTIKARASIDNKDDFLRPGMSFRTRWEIPGERYATVPEISLQWERGGSYIWIIRDNKAQRVNGKVIARTAGMVLLDGDIKEGDAVVIEGLQRLREGQAVEILGSAAP